MLYYASPSGSPSGNGSIGNPWDLQTGLNQSLTSGDTLYLRGGTYLGKFASGLTGGTVCSYPGEWAVIDGNYTTTLNGAIDSSQTTFALTSASQVLAASPGVTEIWIDNEVIHVYGKSGNTITQSIRGYTESVGGAASHANGATVRLMAAQLLVSGTNTIYRDFEITTSLPNRSGIYQDQRGHGVFLTGTGNSFINLVIHDTVVGIFTGSDSGNTLIYGTLVYNCGMESDLNYGSSEPRGLNMYLENGSGYSRVYEVLNLNSFTNGANYYGVSASYVGGDTYGSVFANAGAPIQSAWPLLSYPALWVGTGSVEIPYASIDQSYFWLPDANDSGLLKMGYGAGMADGDVTNSIFVGALTGVEFSPTIGTFTGNIIDVNRGSTSRHLLSPGTSNTINNNTYYHAASPATSGWFYYGAPGHTTVDFTQWKIDSGYDTASTASSSAIPDTVVVRPNAYETGRAHIIIFAASSPSSINVNLATTGLVHGQSYTLKNAFDYNGTVVKTGVHDSSNPTISIDMMGAVLNVATPTGMVYTASTSAPNFAALVLVPDTMVPTTLSLNGTVSMRGVTLT